MPFCVCAGADAAAVSVLRARDARVAQSDPGGYHCRFVSIVGKQRDVDGGVGAATVDVGSRARVPEKHSGGNVE